MMNFLGVYMSLQVLILICTPQEEQENGRDLYIVGYVEKEGYFWWDSTHTSYFKKLI